MGGRGGSSGNSDGNSRGNISNSVGSRRTLADINARSHNYANRRRDQYNLVHDSGTLAQLETFKEVEYLLGRASSVEGRGNAAQARQLMQQAKSKYDSLPNNLKLMEWDEF